MYVYMYVCMDSIVRVRWRGKVLRMELLGNCWGRSQGGDGAGCQLHLGEIANSIAD